MSKLHRNILIVVGLFVLFELALYCAVNDLNIWLDYGNPTSKMGLIIEVLGELVAPLLVIGSGLIVMMYYIQEPPSRMRTAHLIGSVLCTVVAFTYSIILFSRLENVWAVIIGTVITLGAMTLLLWVLRKVDAARLFQLYCIALTAIFYCLAVLLVICAIKAVWGRVRPRDLETLEQFTAWYLPQGFTGNRSFPSGHTANASTLLIITMFAPIIKNKIAKVVLYVVPILWIGFMIGNRIYIGAHYASDTLFSLTISLVLLVVVKRYTTKFIAKTLE